MREHSINNVVLSIVTTKRIAATRAFENESESMGRYAFEVNGGN